MKTLFMQKTKTTKTLGDDDPVLNLRVLRHHLFPILLIAPSGGFPFIDPDAFAVPSRPCRRSLCPSTRDELPSRCSPVDTLTASPRASDRPPALSRSSRNERANPDPLPPRALLSMIRFCLLLEGDSSTSPPTTPSEQALFLPKHCRSFPSSCCGTRPSVDQAPRRNARGLDGSRKA
ncbi:hypothetical protein ACCO45_010291 [Purpureocillium lilacinum]|uniref:Uncharacterized protein n=1 Tax=Purpureocillium lilacinum TaxID=33203 RepID=A0ACC4DHE6_PURLI